MARRPIFSAATRFASSSSRMRFFVPVSDMPNGFRRVADRRVAGAEPFRARPAGRVGEGRECAIDVWILNH
jgi:hypothetical protein